MLFCVHTSNESSVVLSQWSWTISAQRITVNPLFSKVLNSSKMFHLEVVVFLVMLVPADVGEPLLWFGMQLHRDGGFSCQELSQPLTGVFFFLPLHIHGSPWLPIPNFYLHPPWPHLRGECRAAIVPCVAWPAARWRTSRGRLTAGSLSVPCDQLRVSAATVAARRAPTQAILDRNSSIPPSRQTGVTLKVNRDLDRDTDNSGGCWPPVCLATGAAAAFF